MINPTQDPGSGHQHVAKRGRTVLQPSTTDDYKAAKTGSLLSKKAFSLCASSGPEEQHPHLLDDDSDDSDDEDDDEEPEGDVNKMLVKAWESQVGQFASTPLPLPGVPNHQKKVSERHGTSGRLGADPRSALPGDARHCSADGAHLALQSLSVISTATRLSSCTRTQEVYRVI